MERSWDSGQTAIRSEYEILNELMGEFPELYQEADMEFNKLAAKVHRLLGKRQLQNSLLSELRSNEQKSGQSANELGPPPPKSRAFPMAKSEVPEVVAISSHDECESQMALAKPVGLQVEYQARVWYLYIRRLMNALEHSHSSRLYRRARRQVFRKLNNCGYLTHAVITSSDLRELESLYKELMEQVPAELHEEVKLKLESTIEEERSKTLGKNRCFSSRCGPC